VSGEKTTMAGAKGFAIILGSMIAIIGALWLIASMVAPH
jgi:preprotein translocase subunit SecG